MQKELVAKDLQVKALREYKERREQEEDLLRLHGGYELASMPLKRTPYPKPHSESSQNMKQA